MTITRTGFQSFVNNQPAPAVEGDFASANIRTSLPAPPSGYVAVPAGVTIGRFGWANYDTADAANYLRVSAQLGFIPRAQQAIITTFLADATLLQVVGQPVVLFSEGDFWVNFATSAAVGDKVYADPVTGAATSGATGASVSTTMTASLASTGVLTVSAVTSTILAAGQLVTGTGVPDGTYIVSQLTGSAGDVGTYQLSATGVTLGSRSMKAWGAQETKFTVASPVLADAAITASLAATGVLTVSAVASGVLDVGQFLSGTSVPANVRILNQLTGTAGSTGTYTVSLVGTVIGSESMTATAGKLGKITSW